MALVSEHQSSEQLSSDQLSSNQLSYKQLSSEQLSTEHLSSEQLSSEQMSQNDIVGRFSLSNEQFPDALRDAYVTSLEAELLLRRRLLSPEQK